MEKNRVKMYNQGRKSEKDSRGAGERERDPEREAQAEASERPTGQRTA